jgi:hypothetical protein
MYEDFHWRGSFAVDVNGEVTSMTLGGSAVVSEDVCNGPSGGATREIIGKYDGTYEGHAERSCER